jgi:hypothetical protein
MLSTVVLVGALVLASGASAKGWPPPVSAQICGASGCRTVTDSQARLLAGEIDPRQTPLDRVAPAPPSNFYAVELFAGRAAESESLGRLYYVPAERAIRPSWDARPAWRTLGAARRLEALVADLEPFPRPVIVEARVDGKKAARPSSYLTLFSVPAQAQSGDPVSVFLAAGDVQQVWRDWMFIELVSARPSPWTDDTTELWLERDGQRLIRDGQTISLADDVAHAIHRRQAVALAQPQPLTPPSGVLGAAVAGLCAAAYIWWSLRRRGKAQDRKTSD